jgi:hypothetical protein
MLVPFAMLASVLGLIWYSSRHSREHGGAPPVGPLPAGPPGPGAYPMPHRHGGHRHGHEMPAVTSQTTPEWLEPGMSPQYAQAVWQAYYFERDPRNLHAFGDRLHEMSMHRAAEALHRRAEAMHFRAAHEGAHHFH